MKNELNEWQETAWCCNRPRLPRTCPKCLEILSVPFMKSDRGVSVAWCCNMRFHAYDRKNKDGLVTSYGIYMVFSDTKPTKGQGLPV